MGKSQDEKKKRRRHGESSSSSDEPRRVSQHKKKAQNKPPKNLTSKMSQLDIGNIPTDPEMPESSTVKSDGKKRLFLGEGSLSGSLAMAKKHPETAQGIDATTYEKEDHELFKPGSEGAENKQELEKLGAKVTHGVDATDLSQFHGNTFDHAYFNYPRVKGHPEGNSTKKLLNESLAEIGPNVLKQGGKVHYAVPSSETYSGTDAKTPQAIRNSLYGATPIKDAQAWELKPHKKLRDPQDRYGAYGYHHEKSESSEGRAGLKGREFILKREENDMSYVDETPPEYSDMPTDSGTDSEFESERSKDKTKK